MKYPVKEENGYAAFCSLFVRIFTCLGVTTRNGEAGWCILAARRRVAVALSGYL